jgi:hypothetical protein
VSGQNVWLLPDGCSTEYLHLPIHQSISLPRKFPSRLKR